MAHPGPRIIWPAPAHSMPAAPCSPVDEPLRSRVTLLRAEFAAEQAHARREPVPDWAMERLAESVGELIQKAMS